MEPILKLDHIQKYYGNEGNITKAIQDISFSVEAGEFLGIMGASGSGKTTLLNCISTIDSVSSGHIYLGEQDLTTISSAKMAAFRREAGHHDFCQGTGLRCTGRCIYDDGESSTAFSDSGRSRNHLRR